jgi:3-phosphoshikimate 1-carboxyvinyltransferase
VVDIHHAGTAMRFLTAFFAVNEGREVVLTGSQRMTEPYQSFSRSTRTIGDNNFLMRSGLSAYSNQRTKITASKVNIPANVSSQYISALMLVASKLEKESN